MSGCHENTKSSSGGLSSKETSCGAPHPKVALIGNPNVGKSALFNSLTGHYVTVANYPGTTVEVSRGKVEIQGTHFEIIDTPGLYAMEPINEEERVARRILLDESPFLVLHVMDAKNLQRMLPLTLQFLEAGVPLALVLNMMDEARRSGVEIDCKKLSLELGIPVLETVSITGEGMKGLQDLITQTYAAPALKPSPKVISYDSGSEFSIDQALRELERLLDGDIRISKRAVGVLLLSGDEEIWKLVEGRQHAVMAKVTEIIKRAEGLKQSVEYDIALALRREGLRITELVFKVQTKSRRIYNFLDRLTLNPWTGLPILLAILYWGFYQFVGVFGAGTVVNFLERNVFEHHLNPFFVHLATQWIPWPILRDLFVGEYGVLTLGLRYSLALILPIVTFYFLVFAVIEDIGYLPRLAMLMDRAFKGIGLSGRAVIPMVLGFGCDTMATMVTRTLPTPRERIIATLLLSLTIPCSAQLGVILAIMSGHGLALLIWGFVLIFVFIFIGFLTAQILPGERPSFYMELPPLRLPHPSHVFIKTYTRVKWYFYEVLPLFILASVLIWLGQVTGILDKAIRLLNGPVQLIGLPPAASKMFFMGFFRRDYGAAGLYDLAKTGALTNADLLVACVALTLFLPCIAQFLMNVKERGWKTGLVISGFTLVFAYFVAWGLHQLLVATGIGARL